MNRWRLYWILTSVFATICALSLISFLRVAGRLQTAEEALADFYSSETRAENERMDPLIRAGTRVAPLVTQEIMKRDMKHRRYAIAFLGYEGHRPAIPMLVQIVKDEDERDLFRGDALAAIYQIEPDRAREMAKLYSDRADYLGRVAESVVSGSGHYVWDRARWHDLLYKHE